MSGKMTFQKSDGRLGGSPLSVSTQQFREWLEFQTKAKWPLCGPGTGTRRGVIFPHWPFLTAASRQPIYTSVCDLRSRRKSHIFWSFQSKIFTEVNKFVTSESEVLEGFWEPEVSRARIQNQLCTEIQWSQTGNLHAKCSPKAYIYCLNHTDFFFFKLH